MKAGTISDSIYPLSKLMTQSLQGDSLVRCCKSTEYYTTKLTVQGHIGWLNQFIKDTDANEML